MPLRLLALARRNAVALVALFVALGGSSYAAMSAHTSRASRHVILGCVGKNTGTLRVVDSPIRCGSLETPISFNREGRPGAPGPRGRRGPAGEQGVAGAAGSRGEKGDAGATGQAGAPGGRGDKGDPGSPGAAGNDGAPGAAGKDGKDGAPGAAGTDGQSVTSTPEPAGANCPSGGVKYTSASGSDYVCNGSSDSASAVLTKLRTVDGSGSGLDADTLDGLHASELVSQNQFGTLFGADDSTAMNSSAGLDFYMGQVFLTAVSYPPQGTAFAAGQTLPIQQNQALFALLGTRFGGDGVSTFRLPDLRKQSPAGLHYLIVTSGVFPSRP